MYKGNLTALAQEYQWYCQLQFLQVIYIPPLVPNGVFARFASSNMLGFGMELLEPLVDDISSWSQITKRDAYDCLVKLAEVGHVRHNDIRGENFGIYNGKVLVFDLEDISSCNDTAFEHYRKKLVKIFL